MKQLTIQILLESAWVDVATLTLLQPELGNASPTRLGYELDYAINWMDRNDKNACSLTLPIHLMVEHKSPHWFRFLDDIVPSGAARHYWINQLGLQGAFQRNPGYRITVKRHHRTHWQPSYQGVASIQS